MFKCHLMSEAEIKKKLRLDMLYLTSKHCVLLEKYNKLIELLKMPGFLNLENFDSSEIFNEFIMGRQLLFRENAPIELDDLEQEPLFTKLKLVILAEPQSLDIWRKLVADILIDIVTIEFFNDVQVKHLSEFILGMYQKTLKI